MAGIMIPLIAAWIGWLVHVGGTNVEYLKQAVAELSSKDTDPALRAWAVDVFVKTSPVPVDKELENSLKQGRVSLQDPLAASLHPGGDLSGADLSNRDLSSLQLSETNLSRANLRNANLSHSDLSKAQLMNATLTSANLSGADLSNAFLDFADLTGAILTDANLMGARLVGANLVGLDLSSSRGLELDQLLGGSMVPDPREYGGHRLVYFRVARWDNSTRFPKGIAEKLARPPQ
jgi:hypothetical protein